MPNKVVVSNNRADTEEKNIEKKTHSAYTHETYTSHEKKNLDSLFTNQYSKYTMQWVIGAQ